MERLKKILKQAIPWILTIAILAYIFGTQDYHKIYQTFSKANLLLYIPIGVCILITTYTLDCISQWLALKWFCAPVPYKDVAVARGVSFLPMLINFNLGQGGMVYFFYRLTGKSLKKVTSAFFFTAYGDVYAWMTAFTAGMFLLIGEPRFSRWLVPFCTLSWLYWFMAYFYWRRGWNYKFFGFLRDWEILSSFKEAKLWHYAVMYAVRFPLYLLILFIFYLSMKSFGGNVPLSRFIVLMPLVLLISGLPITVAGLGTTQVGFNMLMGGDTGAEMGTALTLTVQFTMITVNTIIALICLPFGKSFLTAMKESQKEQKPDSQVPAGEALSE